MPTLQDTQLGRWSPMKKEIMPSADDQFLYAHDFARLYVAINIATLESLQFLFPEATSFDNGVALWDSIVAKLFGTTYKDALDAADKLRRWSIDPSKYLQSIFNTIYITSCC